MANELRHRQGFLAGTILNNPLAAGDTTLNSAELASLAVIDTTKHAAIVLDPDATAGPPEIVYVTAHTASATSATILRGQEGTTARQHAQGVAWEHALTLRDISAGRIAFATTSTARTVNSTTWTDFNTATDLTLRAQAGDVIRACANGRWTAGSGSPQLDIAIIGDDDNPIRYFCTGPGGGGVPALGYGAGYTPVSCVIHQKLQPTDIRSDGTVRLRLRCALFSPGSTNMEGLFHWWAENLGPQAA